MSAEIEADWLLSGCTWPYNLLGTFSKATEDSLKGDFLAHISRKFLSSTKVFNGVHDCCCNL